MKLIIFTHQKIYTPEGVIWETTREEYYGNLIQFENQTDIDNGYWFHVWEDHKYGEDTDSDYSISFDPKTDDFMLMSED